MVGRAALWAEVRRQLRAGAADRDLCSVIVTRGDYPITWGERCGSMTVLELSVAAGSLFGRALRWQLCRPADFRRDHVDVDAAHRAFLA